MTPSLALATAITVPSSLSPRSTRRPSATPAAPSTRRPAALARIGRQSRPDRQQDLADMARLDANLDALMAIDPDAARIFERGEFTRCLTKPGRYAVQHDQRLQEYCRVKLAAGRMELFAREAGTDLADFTDWTRSDDELHALGTSGVLDMSLLAHIVGCSRTFVRRSNPAEAVSR